jgi:hypothetical protein
MTLQDSIKAEKAMTAYKAWTAQSLAHWLRAIKRKAFDRSVAAAGVKKLQTKSPIPCYSFRVI